MITAFKGAIGSPLPLLQLLFRAILGVSCVVSLTEVTVGSFQSGRVGAPSTLLPPALVSFHRLLGLVCAVLFLAAPLLCGQAIRLGLQYHRATLNTVAFLGQLLWSTIVGKLLLAHQNTRMRLCAVDVLFWKRT